MSDLENRTEAPSGRRLQQARDEGQVPVGHDAAMVAALAGGAAGLWMLASAFRSGTLSLLAGSLRTLPETPFRLLPVLAARPAVAALGACLLAAAAAIAATMAQTQGGFWPHLALPDLTRVFGGGRLSRVLSREFFLDLGLAIVKVVALAWAAWTSMRDDLLSLPLLLGAAAPDQLSRTFAILARTGVRLLGVAAVLAGLELALTRWRFLRKMRMTKEEARRESREDEGDPLVRSRRKKRHRELARGVASVEVPRADALIVNPTHVAIAIRYRRDEGRAPRVTAKGKGALAEYMRDLARSSGIPIVQDVPLARLLYRKVKVGRAIPAATYKAVAAVLAYVYRITGRSAGSEVRP